MNDPTGVALLRGYENLHHIMNAKKMLGKNVFESLVPLKREWKFERKFPNIPATFTGNFHYSQKG
eukprot:scaffold5828_cov85-Skeletonema_dohrnii-CCMP3373.AAC.5